MGRLVFVCEPDENGVYSIGDRYINLKKYVDPCACSSHTIVCPVCTATQCISFGGSCVVCGFDMFHSDKNDLIKFIEENKEKIEDLKKNYGR